jgi:hypothetical protein
MASESGVTVWLPHVLEGIRSEVDSTTDRDDVPYERVLTIHCRGKRKADGEPLSDIPTDLDEHLKAREKGFGIEVYDGRPHPIYTKRVKITNREKLDKAILELSPSSSPPSSQIPQIPQIPTISQWIPYLVAYIREKGCYPVRGHNYNLRRVRTPPSFPEPMPHGLSYGTVPTEGEIKAYIRAHPHVPLRFDKARRRFTVVNPMSPMQ